MSPSLFQKNPIFVLFTFIISGGFSYLKSECYIPIPSGRNSPDEKKLRVKARQHRPSSGRHADQQVAATGQVMQQHDDKRQGGKIQQTSKHGCFGKKACFANVL